VSAPPQALAERARVVAMSERNQERVGMGLRT
jgi:hypothetical protein